MVEYGVNTNNKFVFLDGDEGSDVEDPQELIRRAEIAQKKDERTATQKKAEKLAAAKAKKEAIAEAAVKAAQREEAAKKAAHGKENRPEGGGERGGRGRGRGGERGGGGFRGAGGERRGGRGGGPGGEHGAGGEAFADRFGEGGGRGRGGPRGGRGGPRPPFRGRGGNHQPGSGGEDGAPQHRPEVTFNENQENINVNGGEENGPRGGFRGGRGGRGRGDFGARPRIGYAGRGGGRQFDRQSGSDKTGVKAVDKKDGHGRGNWGDNADEIAGETEPVPAGEGEEVVEKAPPPPREKTDEEKAREAEEEALAKLKTLAEFKAELDSKREQPKFNIRRGGEDETSFGKLVKIEKKNEGEEQREETIVVKKEPRSKPLEIDIHFTDSGARGQNSREDRPPRGDRPFRGSRGGPRGGEGGGRGRGGPRGGPGGSGGGEGRGGGNFRGGAHQSHFEVSAEAFPALG